MLAGGCASPLWCVRKAGPWLEFLALERAVNRARALQSGSSSRG